MFYKCFPPAIQAIATNDIITHSICHINKQKPEFYKACPKYMASMCIYTQKIIDLTTFLKKINRGLIKIPIVQR